MRIGPDSDSREYTLTGRRRSGLPTGSALAQLDGLTGEIGCDQALGRTLQRRLSDAHWHKEMKHGSVR